MIVLKAIAELFRYQVVGSIVVLACLPGHERMQLARFFNNYDLPTSFSCDLTYLERVKDYKLLGILYTPTSNISLDRMKRRYFLNHYKWIMWNETLPEIAHKARYDADVLYVKPSNTLANANICIHDVYYHPRDGANLADWGSWTLDGGLKIVYNRERILRRQNLKAHTLKIATPIGSYSNDTYNGTLHDYLMDMSIRELDSGIRIGYYVSNIVVEVLNATKVMLPTALWGTDLHNDSMISELRYGSSDLSGGVLRMMDTRFDKLDYFMSVWPFQVGFTYLAERESSNNMFLEPFTVGVWFCCMSLFLVLALAQRATAKSAMEKEGAFIAALATYLQQDASAVPQGISGRWTFLVLSISAMLIHAYYTSAIVSALMSAGRGGPDSLTALGDSRYAIASEDYEWMRFLMFDVKTNQEDLEYLKNKKMTPDFYQDIRKAVKLIEAGHTAFHTEYNQLFPYLKAFTDEQACKLQYIDTVPEILTWVSTSKRGQWTNTFKIIGAWLHETGISQRLVLNLRSRPPLCRAALLAERVNIYDIAPVLIFTFAGVIASLMILGVEMLVWKLKTTKAETPDEVKDGIDDV